MKLIEELRRSRPKLGKKADYEGSAKAAIYLNCLECMGGARNDVKDCEAQDCALWPFRLGSGNESRTDPLSIPSKEWYEQKMEENTSEELRERGRKLREMNDKI